MPALGVTTFELACIVTTRSEAFHPKVLLAGLAAITACILLLPLLVTSTWSYGAASKVCFDRTFARQNVTKWDVDSQHYDPDWDMNDSAGWRLFPIHLFNSTSTVVSLFGFWVWLFFSPHLAAQDLDRTRTTAYRNPGLGPSFMYFLQLWANYLDSGISCSTPHSTPKWALFVIRSFADLFLADDSTFSFLFVVTAVGSYFALQWLANLLVTATASGSNCTSSDTANQAIWLLNFLASFGLSVVGTNLLCHRYLYEKARVMIQK
jgi:hypothetical protein